MDKDFLNIPMGTILGNISKLLIPKLFSGLTLSKLLFFSLKSVHRGPEKVLIFETNFRGYRIFSRSVSIFKLFDNDLVV